jgi:hypothetical protein
MEDDLKIHDPLEMNRTGQDHDLNPLELSSHNRDQHGMDAFGDNGPAPGQDPVKDLVPKLVKFTAPAFFRESFRAA